MSDIILYRHETRGRSFLYFFGAFVSCGLTTFCIWQDAPWYMYPFTVLPALACLWTIYADTRSGCVLGATSITVYVDERITKVPLSQIKHVQFDISSDGPDSAQIVLTNGADNVPISALCFASTLGFQEALGRAGVAVR